ncbi:hypothetical protein [Luteibacter sp.]|uniref:hypothetical protein n=1 Tax=Luteibacter sp. TaxID=1886636 RepID=UPI003F81C6DF
MKRWMMMVAAVAASAFVAAPMAYVTPGNAISADGYAVAAAVLRSAYPAEATKIVLLGTHTATFACNPAADVGIVIGGCSGMSRVDVAQDDLLDWIQGQLPGVDDELRQRLVAEAQVSSVIDRRLPTDIPQYAPAAPGNAPVTGDPEFAFYMSRPAISRDGKRALIYVGLIFWKNHTVGSHGSYYYLEKREQWTVKKVTEPLWQM